MYVPQQPQPRTRRIPRRAQRRRASLCTQKTYIRRRSCDWPAAQREEGACGLEFVRLQRGLKLRIGRPNHSPRTRASIGRPSTLGISDEIPHVSMEDHVALCHSERFNRLLRRVFVFSATLHLVWTSHSNHPRSLERWSTCPLSLLPPFYFSPSRFISALSETSRDPSQYEDVD